MEHADRMALQRWVLRRDAEAFKKLVSRHAGMVYATCCRILGDTAEAEDVSQECFEVLAQAQGVEKVKSLGAWLHGMATNRSLKRIRSEKRRKDRESRFSRESIRTTEPSWSDIYGYVDEAVAELPPKQRDAVVLYFFEDRTHDAIARQLGVSRTTVTYRIQKGIEGIRKTLRRNGVIVASSALAAMLTGNLVCEAAPQTLTAMLAKLALAGAGELPAPKPRIATPQLGGAVLMKKLVIGVTVLVLAGVAAWMIHTRRAQPPSQEGAGSSQDVAQAEQDVLLESIHGPREQPPEPAQEDDTEVGAILWRNALGGGMGAPDAATASPIVAEEPQGRPIGAISGRVVDMDGTPVAGSQISATGGSASGQATSEEDGTFKADILVPVDSPESPQQGQGRLFTVTAAKESYISTTKIRVTLDSQNVELVLTRNGEIRGYAVDSETGEPIPNPEARIVRHRNPVEGMMGTAHPWSSFDSPEGQFVLPTQYDVGQIAVRAKGYTEEQLALLVPKGEIREGVVVELRPSAYINGIVLDAKTGQPVQSAHVGIATGHIRQWWGLREGNFSTHAISGPDGRFEITQAPPDQNVDLIAWHEDYAAEFVTDVSPSASDDVELLLSQGGILTGTVKREGEPIPGLRMWAGNSFGRPYEHGDEAPGNMAFLALAGTSSDGEYTFAKMPYGRYQIRVMDANPNTPLSGRYLVRRWAEIKDGETTVLDVDVEEGSVVSGTVLGLAGFESVQLRLYDQRYPQTTLYSTEERHDSAKPDALGYFRFPPVPGGDYYVRATLPGTNPRDVEVHFHVKPMETIEIIVDLSQ